MPPRFKQRKWLAALDELYNPAIGNTQGCVLLLDGHIDDLFFADVTRPQVTLPQLLLTRYRQTSDAFIWHQRSAGSGRITYEFNHLKPATLPAPKPAAAPRMLSPLEQLRAGAEEDEAEFVGTKNATPIAGTADSHECIPQDAIREVDKLLRERTARGIVVLFHSVDWGIGEDDHALRGCLMDWPQLCLRNDHLVIFALSEIGGSWLERIFVARRKGVERLTVDGPTADEVKAYLMLRSLGRNQALCDWQTLDSIASYLAKNYASDPSRGYAALVLKEIPRLEQAGQVLDENWLNRQPRTGDQAQKVYLDDVVLREEEREFFENELLPLLRNPNLRQEEAARLGVSASQIKVPSRLLLIGPPGTGKTTIGKMIATETSLPFFSVKSADLTSTYRGGPVLKVQEAFAKWRQNAPCVVFMDEVESIAMDRSKSQHEDNAITQLLAELESTKGRDEGLIIICATNTPEKLDKAFLDRFQPRLISYPDTAGLERLVRMYFPGHLLSPDLSTAELARLFQDRAPREIENCASACLSSLTRHKQSMITRAMVERELAKKPIDHQLVQRWRNEERARQQTSEAGNV